jgi:hypothetical protein
MITIPKHRKGDWWDGMTITMKSAQGVPVSFVGKNIKVYFFASQFSKNGKVAFTFSTLDNSIVVNGNKLTFVDKKIDVEPLKYSGVLQVIDSLNRVKTITNVSWEIWI